MSARVTVPVNAVGYARPRAEQVRLPLGQQMREAREAAGLTQRAVARQLFVNIRTVQKWERGNHLPDVDMLDAYLKIVGATITLGATS